MEITHEKDASLEVKQAISRGLSRYNVEKTGDPAVQDLCLTLRDDAGGLVGGLLAEVSWGWLHVFVLWVREDARGQGWGSKLLALAEEEAKKNGATHATLDTFSFQNPAFYEGRGYAVFGKLPDYPPGHTRFFLRKRLS
ncbi:MAG: GNAT family N-acetyltransferase [Planctomycetota bacterium]|jgi:GNAT superfamily N-acetyltransferase